MTPQLTTPGAFSTAPEHTFLTTQHVFDRYRWKRTHGYQMINTAEFPCIGGRFRLDTLIAWEDARAVRRPAGRPRRAVRRASAQNDVRLVGHAKTVGPAQPAGR